MNGAPVVIVSSSCHVSMLLVTILVEDSSQELTGGPSAGGLSVTLISRRTVDKLLLNSTSPPVNKENVQVVVLQDWHGQDSISNLATVRKLTGSRVNRLHDNRRYRDRQLGFGGHAARPFPIDSLLQ